MTASIVIPNWNGREKLEKNLPHVLKVQGVGEVIVVDDGSTDNSVEFIENNYPQIVLIKKNINEGFSSAVNCGVEKAKGALVFLINSDASPQEDSLMKTLKHFENLQVFSVSCNVGGNWSWAEFKNGYYWHYQAKGEFKEFHPTLWASGGSGIFRKDIWDKLGGLDELFNPFYEEDIDLGFRATKSGYLNIWEPKSKVEHYEQKGVIEENFSKEKIAKTAQRNQLLFIWKNITNLNFLMSHVVNLLVNCLVHPKYLLIFFSALVLLPSILAKRKAAVTLFKIDDQEIFARYAKSST